MVILNESNMKKALCLIKEQFNNETPKSKIYLIVNKTFNINIHRRTFDNWYNKVIFSNRYKRDQELMNKWKKEYLSKNIISEEEMQLENMYSSAKSRGLI